MTGFAALREVDVKKAAESPITVVGVCWFMECISLLHALFYFLCELTDMVEQDRSQTKRSLQQPCRKRSYDRLRTVTLPISRVDSLADEFSVSFEVEEGALVRDLMFVLSGADGRFVAFDADSGRYRVSPKAGAYDIRILYICIFDFCFIAIYSDHA